MEVPTKLPFFFNNKILLLFPCHGCGNYFLFVVNAITTFTLIGATINPTYKGNCWGIDGQCILHQNRIKQGFFCRGPLVKYGGVIQV
jgi:hypothetical protein